MNRTYLSTILLVLFLGTSAPAAGQAVLFREEPSLEASLTVEEKEIFDAVKTNDAYIYFDKIVGRYDADALNSERVSMILRGKEYMWERITSRLSKVNGSLLWVGALEGTLPGEIDEASFTKTVDGRCGGMFGLDTSIVGYYLIPLNERVAFVTARKERNPSPYRTRTSTPRKRIKSNDTTLFRKQIEEKKLRTILDKMMTEIIENQSKLEILVAYTGAAQQGIGIFPPLKEQIENQVNLIFESSGLENFDEIRVVGIVKAKNADGSDFVEGDRSYAAILAHLEQTGEQGGVLDQVRDVQRSVGADLVVLLARPDNQGNLGIASGPQRQVGSNLFRSPEPGMCCIVVNANTIYSQQDKCFTLTHEIGHNIGLYHDWANRHSSDQPRRKYARGYTRYFANTINGFNYEGDVMAYAVFTGFHKLRFFSNPALTYLSVDGNIRNGGIIDTADAAQFIDEFYTTVKGFAFAPTNTILNKTIETQYQMSLYATNSIRNDASFLATSGADVRFTAGSKVTLKPGFRAATGSKFVAKIGTGSSASEGLSTAPSGIVAVSTSATANEERPEKRAATESVSEGSALPTAFALFQNYPNPFNPTTTIRYALPRSAKVVLAVYDVLGRKAMELVNETKAAGFYEVSLNAGSLSSGTYLYRLQAGEYVETRKMVVMK